MNLVSASLSRKCIVCRLKIGYLKLHVLGAEVLRVSKVKGRVIWPMGVIAALELFRGREPDSDVALI
jgi:hypothetical protein